MNRILLIGAGQLGSRHLQGLLALNGQNEVFVLDPSMESLKISKERAKEVHNEHMLNFATQWSELPASFDLVIVATNSNVREKVVSTLLNNYEVKYLILEKVLFQKVEDYKVISELIKSKNVKSWVNHPRRMFEGYKHIKNLLATDDSCVSINVVGGNWGLACNGLHFLDLCLYLTGSVVQHLDMDWIDNVIHESKRSGYIEFTGTMKGQMLDKCNFTITSFDGEQEPIIIYITSKKNRWVIREGADTDITHMSKTNLYKPNDTISKMYFQSSSTTNLVNEILTTGECLIPTFEDASATHIVFIKGALKKYNQITGDNTEVCPIT